MDSAPQSTSPKMETIVCCWLGARRAPHYQHGCQTQGLVSWNSFSCIGNTENCFNTELQHSHFSRSIIKAQLYTPRGTMRRKIIISVWLCNSLPTLFGKVFTFPNVFSLAQSGFKHLSKYLWLKGPATYLGRKENSLINMFCHK